MTCLRFSRAFPSCFAAVLASVLAPTLLAQGPLPDAPVPDAPAPAVQPVLSGFVATGNPVFEHKFWDRENYALFAASAAMNTADFAVTRANLQSGGRELNPMVRVFGRSTAGLAANFAGETFGVVGLSYFCHKTGHHRMERMVSMVNIGGSMGAVSYGLAHRNSSATTAGTPSNASRRAITIKLRISGR